MIFEELIKENREEFKVKVESMSTKLIVPTAWPMFGMWFETAGTLDHQKVNFQKGDNPDPAKRCQRRATGLIQFMPSTSRWLGTTNLDLYHMTNVEQLDYVEKYLMTYKGKYKTFDDLYLAIFWPAAIGKPDDYKIGSKEVARQNPIFDPNKDEQITKAEVRQRLFAQIPTQYRQYF
jgi:hypothetical protein